MSELRTNDKLTLDYQIKKLNERINQLMNMRDRVEGIFNDELTELNAQLREMIISNTRG